MSTRRPSTLRRYAPLAFFPLIGLWLTACVPELGVGEEFIDDPRHDYDEDGFTELEGDCDDNNEEMNPDSIWWSDNDGDGYGNSAASITGCAQPPRTVVGVYLDEAGEVPDSALSDCDDTNALINPGATELCDGADNDCDGVADPEGTTGKSTFYEDKDQDSFGSATSAQVGCEDDIPVGFVLPIDLDGDNQIDFDCDDDNAAKYPGNAEVCDGLDNDCDGDADDEDKDSEKLDAVSWYRDLDHDGYGGEDTSDILEQCDDPSDPAKDSWYALNVLDCDDNQATVNPGHAEICDGLDNNCDGDVDENLLETYYLDGDGDGYGLSTDQQQQCGSAPNGYVVLSGDCDDGNPAVNPGALERCETKEVDDDCDGFTEEDDATDAATWYADVDGDNYGDPLGTTVKACKAPAGYSGDTTDCDDQRGSVNPGADETCATTLDDDCDGDTNDLNALACTEFYADGDGDNYGEGSAKCRCEAKNTYTALVDGDCDDSDADTNPDALETCSTPYDDDCDEDDNDEGAIGCEDFYRDDDGDGYGDKADSRCTCDDGGANAWLSKKGDCNDADAAISPDADELCTPDGDTPVDEDCDGETDEGDAVDALTWYADVDGDGYGDASAPIAACEQPSDAVSDASDCDDNRVNVNPGATEDCSTTYDDNCDSDTNDLEATGCSDFYADADGDGYGDGAAQCTCEPSTTHTVLLDGDCDETKTTVNPGASETCATAYDDNCDGDENDQGATACSDFWADTDGDGYGTGTSLCLCVEEGLYEATADGDCDEGDSDINPGAAEECTQGADTPVDENCDSFTDDASAIDALTWYADIDGDGYGDPGAMLLACAEPDDYVGNASDCDDNRVNVNPGATEDCSTTYDDNCDSDTNDLEATGCSDFYADADGDGYGDGAAQCTCEPSTTHTVLLDGDCDETKTTVNPGASETCATAYDDNCDGDENDQGATACSDFWADTDGDGYGTGTSLCLCVEEGLYEATADGDCDEGDSDINPGAAEECTQGADTPVDENCDSFTDDASAIDALTWYADIDDDTYGDPGVVLLACAQPTDYVGDASDCDDDRSQVNPGETETCATAYDDDCDSDPNELNATACDWYYADSDGDGFGTGAGACLCDATTDYLVSTNTDCDDTAVLVNPDASETCSTAGVDDDCSGTANDDDAINCSDYYTDVDGDSYGTGIARCLCESVGDYTASDPGDCDDDPNAGGVNVNPGQVEVCTQGAETPADEDCDSQIDEADADGAVLWYRDLDGDDYGDASDSQSACIQPAGYVDPDFDGDGSDDFDCNDGKENVNPGETETCATGYDDNCDGNDNDDDAIDCNDWYYDGDVDSHGVGAARCLCEAEGSYLATVDDDCDDADALIHPLVAETCATAYDDDCDTDPNELNALSCTNRYYDFDGDEYGITGSTECRCDAVGYHDAPQGGDCDDDDLAKNPGLLNCGLMGDLTSADAVASISGSYDHIAHGDFNGDGWPDLAIGQQGYDNPPYTNSGGVFIFYGPLPGTLVIGAGTNADAVFTTDAPSIWLGRRLSAGDVNGDGNTDLLVMGAGEASAYLVLGPFAGTADPIADAWVTFEKVANAGHLLPDLTGDGRAEVMLDTSTNHMTHYYVYASETLTPGLLTKADSTWSLNGVTAPALVIAPTLQYNRFGRYAAVDSADLDEDGDHEVAVRGRTDVELYDFPQSIGAWVRVSAGPQTTCAIGETEVVVCWGDDSAGVVSDAPAGSFSEVAVGNDHACALDLDGYVECWGDDSLGLLSNAPTSGGFSSLNASDDYACAGPDPLVCWGEVPVVSTVILEDDFEGSALEAWWTKNTAKATHTGDALRIEQSPSAFSDNFDSGTVDPPWSNPSQITHTGSDLKISSSSPTSHGSIELLLGTVGDFGTSLSYSFDYQRYHSGLEIDVFDGNSWTLHETISVDKKDYPNYFPFTGTIDLTGIAPSDLALRFTNTVYLNTTPSYTRLDNITIDGVPVQEEAILAVDTSAGIDGVSISFDAQRTDIGLQVDYFDGGTWVPALTLEHVETDPTPLTSHVSIPDSTHSYAGTNSAQFQLRFRPLAPSSASSNVVIDNLMLGLNTDDPPTTSSIVATGPEVACLLDATGTPSCWGGLSSPVVQAAPTSPGYTAIAVGEVHACVLDATGTITCWGADTFNQITDTPTGTAYSTVSAGGDHTCALDSTGAILCWGDDTSGQVSQAPTDGGFTQLSAGTAHSCALAADGSLTCWGEDTAGQASPPQLPHIPDPNTHQPELLHTVQELTASKFDESHAIGLGDFTGNGFIDLAVGENTETVSHPTLGDLIYGGRVYVFEGSAAGLLAGAATGATGDATLTISGDWTSHQTGSDTQNAGDLDGDGVDDLLTGGGYDSSNGMDESELFYGPLPAGDTYASSYDAFIDTNQTYFYVPVTPAGDLNLDGYDDLIVGNYLFYGAPN